MTLRELRISFVFGRTVLGPLTGDDRPVPRPYVLDRFRYAERFGRPAARPSDPQPPWPAHGRQGMWERYLGVEHNLREVSATRAFAQLVPLRSIVTPLPDSGDPDVRVLAEAFAYPWGIALVITLTATGEWATAAEAGDAAVALRRAAYGSSAIDPGPLDVLAELLLDQLCRETYGDRPGQRWNAEPFSIATLVDGSGALDELHPRERAIHQLLHALSSFSPTYKTDEVGDVGANRVAGRRAPPTGHEVYGTRRGRTVWGPQHFTASGTIRTLGCQHRNLVLASMQAEALMALVRAAHARVEAGEPLGLALRAQTKSAVVALARFYAGTNTFRSGSVRAQIVQNDWLATINAVRFELGMSAIS